MRKTFSSIGNYIGTIIDFFYPTFQKYMTLQIFKYGFYKDLSENNRIAVVPNVPNRGVILDRNGIIMADNYFAYEIQTRYGAS